MKKVFLATLLLIVASITPALAASDFGGAVYGNISAASGAVKTSSAYYVGGFKTKSLQVTGVNLTSTQAAPTFKIMSGTILAECSPSSSGPWHNCTQAQTSAGAAVSLTANGGLSWQDAYNYIRLKWTAATSGQKIKAWISWIAN